MIKILHNPRCSSSREGVRILYESGQKFEIVEYLKNPLTEDEIREIIQFLKIKPIELVRTKEAIWKENYKGKDLTDEQIIKAMTENPRLIERPVVIKDNKAVIGRPPALIKDLL